MSEDIYPLCLVTSHFSPYDDKSALGWLLPPTQRHPDIKLLTHLHHSDGDVSSLALCHDEGGTRFEALTSHQVLLICSPPGTPWQTTSEDNSLAVVPHWHGRYVGMALSSRLGAVSLLGTFGSISCVSPDAHQLPLVLPSRQEGSSHCKALCTHTCPVTSWGFLHVFCSCDSLDTAYSLCPS